MVVKYKSMKSSIHFGKLNDFFSHLKFLGMQRVLPRSLNAQGKWGTVKSLVWLTHDILFVMTCFFLAERKQWWWGGEK